MKDLMNTPLTLVAFGAHPDPFDMPYQEEILSVHG
jgi:hypothetical protein